VPHRSPIVIHLHESVGRREARSQTHAHTHRVLGAPLRSGRAARGLEYVGEPVPGGSGTDRRRARPVRKRRGGPPRPANDYLAHARRPALVPPPHEEHGHAQRTAAAPARPVLASSQCVQAAARGWLAACGSCQKTTKSNVLGYHVTRQIKQATCCYRAFASATAWPATVSVLATGTMVWVGVNLASSSSDPSLEIIL
jgi:hypothetical protein